MYNRQSHIYSKIVWSNLLSDNTRASELCFDILLCVTEDQYAHAFMHDDNQVFPVFIYRTVSEITKES